MYNFFFALDAFLWILKWSIIFDGPDERMQAYAVLVTTWVTNLYFFTEFVVLNFI